MTIKMDTPIGCICIAAEEGKVSEIRIERDAGQAPGRTGGHADREEQGDISKERADLPEDRMTEEVLERTVRQLKEYFRGERKTFDVPIQTKGTPFQENVWKALREIPYGETCSYGDIAKKIGCPKGARAVGAACGRNPVLIVTPCHRVVGGNGALTGFTGGLHVKEKLLELEGV